MRSRRRGLSAAGLCLLAGCSAAPAPPAAGEQPTGPATGAVAATTVSSTAPSTAPPVVVLDPGHDGGNAAHPAEMARLVPDGRGGTKACNTTGTETDAGYPEHAFTFDVAQRVRAELVAAGVEVVSTSRRLPRLGRRACRSFRAPTCGPRAVDRPRTARARADGVTPRDGPRGAPD